MTLEEAVLAREQTRQNLRAAEVALEAAKDNLTAAAQAANEADRAYMAAEHALLAPAEPPEEGEA